jgi:diguanylate cyclase
VKDSATVRRALERLRQLGCRIALDDFGTGYSSLAYITRFPPDRIKIDKAFVHNVDRSACDGAIANAILSLGKRLNLIVTAEGIERSGQLEWLRAAAATRRRVSCCPDRYQRGNWRTAF